jgi:hypothetical protein
MPTFSHHKLFIAGAMELAVMAAAERHGEFVAHLATECLLLGELN